MKIILTVSFQADAGPIFFRINLIRIDHSAFGGDVGAMIIEKHQQNILGLYLSVGFKLDAMLTDVQRHPCIAFNNVALRIHAVIRKAFFDSNSG